MIAGARGAFGVHTLVFGVGLFGVFYIACAKHPVRLATAIALMFVAGAIWGPSQGNLLFAERTFFGVLRVRADCSGKYHQLIHGTTLHGEQAMDPARSSEPRTYYHRDGPIGQVIETLSPRLSRASIAVVGLGIGSL